MLYQSFSFLFLYLPLVVGLWHMLQNRGKHREALLLLTLSSLLYYALYDVKLAGILLISAAVTYGCGLLIMKHKEQAKGVTFAGVLFLLLLLLWSKTLAPSFMATVGISFFALRFISCLLDTLKEKKGETDALLFFSYATFFPLLAQGPIARYEETAGAFKAPERSAKQMTEGVLLFVFGLSKKVLIANVLHPVTEWGFLLSAHADVLTTLLTLTVYAFELYFDFSGYCDMSMGCAKMLGICLPANFDAPYLKPDVRAFWRSWHITLVSFFTRYVYVPLGGSRKGFFRQSMNILAVFLLSALWHGFRVTYILWGLLEGIKVIASHALKRGKIHLPNAAGTIVTFLLFLFTLIFFRAESVTDALTMCGTLSRFRYPGFLFRVAEMFTIPELYLPEKAYLALFQGAHAEGFRLIALLLFLVLCIWLLRKGNAYTVAEKLRKDTRTRVALLTALLLVSSVISITGVSSFLYFRY